VWRFRSLCAAFLVVGRFRGLWAVSAVRGPLSCLAGSFHRLSPVFAFPGLLSCMQPATADCGLFSRFRHLRTTRAAMAKETHRKHMSQGRPPTRELGLKSRVPCGSRSRSGPLRIPILDPDCEPCGCVRCPHGHDTRRAAGRTGHICNARHQYPARSGHCASRGRGHGCGANTDPCCCCGYGACCRHGAGCTSSRGACCGRSACCGSIAPAATKTPAAIAATAPAPTGTRIAAPTGTRNAAPTGARIAAPTGTRNAAAAAARTLDPTPTLPAIAPVAFTFVKTSQCKCTRVHATSTSMKRTTQNDTENR
jgi:hypothetical protein